MKIEAQVCALELAKKLKELGVKRESYFVWFKLKGNTEWDLSESWQIDDAERFHEISAFTATELGEMLPQRINIDNCKYWYGTGKSAKDDKYYPQHEVNYGHEDCFHLKRDDNEANARAKMLIYLLENNFVKAEDLNEG